MTANDLIILDRILEQKKAEDAPALGADRYFEIFTAREILKNYDLSYDEITTGIVGAGGDGGLDSIFVFVNGDLIQEDTDISSLPKNASIELIFLQSKTTAGFSEDAITKFKESTGDLLDLSKPLASLATVYNEQVLGVMQRFRAAYESLASRLPKLKISYFYATRGTEIHPNVQRKVEGLEQKVRSLFSEVEFGFEFLTASKLLALVRRQPRTTYSLNVSETPISSGGAFVCLVSLKGYVDFITDDKHALIRGLFDANVRDYQGSTQVNEEIQGTLRNREDAEEFWWLNNGISILASRATLTAKTLTIENPQVVNGLQTSREIYEYFRTGNTDKEARTVLVRVIVPGSEDSRDRIIKASNSQTAIPVASLRSTEKIHRDIEEFFRSHGLFYDRRKNFHKNEGRPLEKIVSIPYLAQAVTAIVLQRPDTARARPSSLLKKDEEYIQVFSEQYPIALYLKCANLMRVVDKFLRSEDSDVEGEHQTNLRFYVAMDVACTLVSKAKPRPKDIESLNIEGIAEKAVSDSVQRVRTAYEKLGKSDQVAKGSELRRRLVQSLAKRFPKRAKGVKPKGKH